jgi:Holliday junction resolvasome RuvABC endonuclease subunit
MRITALDISLTSTGVAENVGPTPTAWTLKPPKLRGVHRLRWFREAVGDITYSTDLVIMEGYSFGSRGRALFSIGELGGVIRLALDDMDIPWVALAPSTVKKLATGKGNASKDLVLVEAVKRLGYAGSSNDECDALWLLQAGLIHYGLPGAAELPKSHLTALQTIEWPEFASVGGAA